MRDWLIGFGAVLLLGLVIAAMMMTANEVQKTCAENQIVIVDYAKRLVCWP